MKKGLIFGLGIFGVLLASCATPPPPEPEPEPEPVVYVPPPKPELYVPTFTVDQRMAGPLVRTAGGHAAFISSIDQYAYVPLETAEDLNRTMDNMSSFFTPQLGQGFIATGGLVAAQNHDFVEGVRRRAENEGRDVVIQKLLRSPAYATSFQGAQSAARDVQAVWQSDISRLQSAATSYKQQAYDLQKDPKWAKMRGDNRETRQEAVKQARLMSPYVDNNTLRQIASAGTIRRSEIDGEARRNTFHMAYGRGAKPDGSYITSPVMGRNTAKALTLGALEILGATDEPNSAFILNKITTPKLNQCVTWATLQFDVCLAAGYYKYEDSFCVAEHIFTDMAECLSEVAQ